MSQSKKKLLWGIATMLVVGVICYRGGLLLGLLIGILAFILIKGRIGREKAKS